MEGFCDNGIAMSLMFCSIPEIIHALSKLLAEHVRRTSTDSAVLFLGENEWYAVQQWRKSIKSVHPMYKFPFDGNYFAGANIILVKQMSYAMVMSISEKPVKIK